MRNEELMKKWAPVLEHSALPAISDNHKEAVTATLLENTEQSIREGSSLGTTGMLAEAAPTNSMGASSSVANAGNVDTYDPVLISLVRRAMPNLVAYDIVGVQPMTGPTGLVFAMKSNYGAQDGSGGEALFDDVKTGFGSKEGNGTGVTGEGTLNSSTGEIASGFTVTTGSTTAQAEAQGTSEVATLTGGSYAQNMTGDVSETDAISEMSFKIDKVAVTAVSRALKAEYSSELAQDLKAIHGLDAETELANMLSAELLTEINREVVRTVYVAAKAGGQDGTAAKGVFNLDVDSNGRWSVEKFKGLMFQIEREANAIAKATRRGKGNIVICSSDVASALQMAGVLDYAPALNNGLNVDDTGNTFAGVLNGRYKVYIDPFAGKEYLVVGYKGDNAFYAGIFYCPYVPLQMVRAVGENSFQSKIGFKTRYGMVANPLASATGAVTAGTNGYYRRLQVTNLL